MRVLVVAYYFPPIGGGGVNRTLKLVRGLVATGCTPIVLTVDGARWTQDRELLQQVPSSVQVLRLANPDWGRVAGWMRRGANRAGETAGSGGRLGRWLVPDLHVLWSALTVPVAAAMAATRAIDLVYTTCPPYSANAAGWVAGALGVPWVADFRDSWIECPTRVELPPWRRRLEKRMEAVVLGSADEVLFASDGARARAIARLPDLASRSQTILTGYDAADFAGVPGGSAPQNTLEIIHAGSVLLNHMGATLDRLIEALVGWSTADSSVASTVRFRFVGGEPELERRFKRAGVGSWVQVEPAVSRRALAQRLRRAQVALALASPARYGEDPIPGKIFDAVGAGLPVFAMTPEGSLADLVRRRSLGVAIDPGDPGAIVHHLSELRTRILRGETIEGPPESSRHALSNERAVERAIAAMCDVRKRAIHRRNRRCPSPSVS